MSFQVLDAGTLRTITGGQVKVAGVMRPLRFIKVMDGGVLRTVASFVAPLSVTAVNASGSGDGSEGATVGTTTTTAVVSGGLAPFTYQWALVTNGGGEPSGATATTSASTAFYKMNVPTQSVFYDIWSVTVTDSLGSTASATVTVTFRNIPTGGTL